MLSQKYIISGAILQMSLDILKQYDIIVDATDNLDTRYIINDSCVILGKPMVHGAIYKYEGVISVFNYKGGPTYRCFNPEPAGEEFKNPLPVNSGPVWCPAGGSRNLHG